MDHAVITVLAQASDQIDELCAFDQPQVGSTHSSRDGLLLLLDHQRHPAGFARHKEHTQIMLAFLVRGRYARRGGSLCPLAGMHRMRLRKLLIHESPAKRHFTKRRRVLRGDTAGWRVIQCGVN